MSQYGWNNAPARTRLQVRRLVEQTAGLLGVNLRGMYLHGSLSMGCFNPRRSDLDILVMTSHQMDLDTKRRIAALLLTISGLPHPLEISFIPRDCLFPWRYPTPYDFHYSEAWREKMLSALQDGAWKNWNDETRVDPDLAAHITITKHRGICLHGQPICTVLPDVPADDYMASIMNDVQESLEGQVLDPVYSVLNICRVAAFKRDGLICSKKEGGQWALRALPDEIRPLIAQMLQIYAGHKVYTDLDPLKLTNFLILMRTALSKQASN